MAWVELFPTPTELQLNNGVVKWNTALQITMGDPEWVELMHDSANGRLGIRATYASTGLPVVKEPEGSEYWVDSELLLDAAGVPIDITVSAAPPEQWRQSEAGSGATPNEWFGSGTIYYLELP